MVYKEGHDYVIIYHNTPCIGRAMDVVDEKSIRFNISDSNAIAHIGFNKIVCCVSEYTKAKYSQRDLGLNTWVKEYYPEYLY